MAEFELNYTFLQGQAQAWLLFLQQIYKTQKKRNLVVKNLGSSRH
jgi:hypothetical protein